MDARDICAEHFIQYPMMTGSPGVVVQIDETMFVRRKHNVGRRVTSQSVFGGIDCHTKESFLFNVHKLLTCMKVEINCIVLYCIVYRAVGVWRDRKMG